MKRKYFILGIIILTIIIISCFIWKLDIGNWKKFDIRNIYNMELSTVIYDDNGNEAIVISANANRDYTNLETLPDYIHQAFVAAEDIRFYKHNGIDVKRMAAALISNIKAMAYKQGASTITQQLIKLTHLSSEKTMSRKIQEIFLAITAEKQMSKSEILEAYINVVYFGGGAYGIDSAARRYFSKEPYDLTISEAALLAGIIKSPNNYAPHIDMNAALVRRDYVLRSMKNEGFISEDEFKTAIEEIPVLNETDLFAYEYGWYADETVKEACDVLGITKDELWRGGYAIYTSLNIEIQQAAEKIMKENETYPEAAAQGAMVVVKAENSEIKAVVGGRSYETRFGLNRACAAYRQPGSLIKPISTYAAAVENFDYLPSSKLYDIKRVYDGGYSPGNAGGSYYDETYMRNALAKSLNAATVDLAETIGIAAVADMLKEFNINVDKNDYNLALALGAMTNGVTPLQMCGAYAVLANGGKYNAPHFIRHIENKYGTIVYEYNEKERRVISDESAFILTNMLESAAQDGTASSLNTLGITIAAKTGTSGMVNGDTADAWATAYTPDYVVTVWIGKDSNSDGGMAGAVSGSGYAIPVCKRLFEEVPDLRTSSRFIIPNSLQSVLIDEYLLKKENSLALASINTPSDFTAWEIVRDPKNLERSDIWDVPAAVDDLVIVESEKGIPVIQFTGSDEYAEYMIIREKNGYCELAGIVQCDYEQLVRFADTNADVNSINSYSVIPRHKLLAEKGITLSGPKSVEVKYTPIGILNSITGLVYNDSVELESELMLNPIF